MDYELLRRMVFQILDERDGKQRKVSIGENNQETEGKEQEENDLLQGFDDTELDGMMASILAFQGQ